MAISPVFVVFWLAVWGLLGVAVGQRRDQSPLGAFLISVVLGPIGVLIVAVSKPDKKIVAKKQRSEGLRKCPYCAEMIKGEATVCRFCGRDVVSV